ncbi:MAG: TadE/TadG family type IV pilus assembly protein [Acidimicrobiales bacterium]
MTSELHVSPGKPERRRRTPAEPARQRRFAGDDGAALLEAALITPVFMVMVLGSLEYGLVYRDYLSLNSATARHPIPGDLRSGLGYRLQGPAGDQKDLGAVPVGNITKIAIFKADTRTDTTSWASCKVGGSVTNRCNVYVTSDWNRTQLYFGCTPVAAIDKAWCPTTRKVGSDGPARLRRRYIKVVHPYLTKLFGTSVTLESYVITRLEPKQLTS